MAYPPASFVKALAVILGACQANYVLVFRLFEVWKLTSLLFHNSASQMSVTTEVETQIKFDLETTFVCKEPQEIHK